MSGALKYDPEWWSAMKPILEASPSPPILKNGQELRDFCNNVLDAGFKQIPQSPAIIRTVYPIPTTGGGRPINLVRFATQEQLDASWAKAPQPAILYMHGGGLVSGGGGISDPLCGAMAAGSGVQVWSVDYRLAPEHPFPAPLDDCWRALTYVHSYRKGLGVDGSRIAVAGTSAGGCLAAGLCLMARDRGLSPPVKKMVLVQPMLDDRTAGLKLPFAGTDMLGFLVWKASDNALGWDAYLGGPSGRRPDQVTFESATRAVREKEGRGVSAYAAPGRCEDLTGMPSTYVDVGGLDLFKVECTDFVGRLCRADVEVEFHLYPGVPHAFEGIPAEVTKRANENLMRVLRSI